jgi:hypothetical protein
VPARTWILTSPPEPEWILGVAAWTPAGTLDKRLGQIGKWPRAATVSV